MPSTFHLILQILWLSISYHSFLLKHLSCVFRRLKIRRNESIISRTPDNAGWKVKTSGILFLLSSFLTHGYCVATFVSLCGHSQPNGFSRYVKTGKHVIMHKQHKYPYGSFACTLQVSFLLSPLSIASVAVWITVFARFDWCLNLFQSIIKYWSAEAELFCIWNILSAAFFGIR